MNLSQHKYWLSIVLLFVTAVSAHGQDEKKVNLSWKLQKGDELTLQFDQTQSVLTRIDARDRSLESELTLVVGWKVLEVAENGDATIEQTIERIRVRTGAPGAEVKKVVDIDTADSKPLRGVSRDVMKQIKPLVGLSFAVVMSTSGKVDSVVAGDDVASVVDALPETSALRNIFTAQAMKKLIQDSAFETLDSDVKKDATWSEKSKLALKANDGRMFQLDRTVDFTVESIDDQFANIDVAISLTQSDGPQNEAPAALTSPLELTGFSGNGKLVFDHAKGHLVSSNISSDTKTRVIYREDQVKTTIGTTNRLTVTRK